MGATVASTTVASKTIEHDDDLQGEIDHIAGAPVSVAFNSAGTGPSSVVKGGSGRFRLAITSGSGTPAIAANNIVLTCPRNVRKVFLACLGTVTPCFHVSSVSTVTVNIGTKVAMAASTAYELEVIVLY